MAADLSSLIAGKSGVSDVGILVDLLEACGFEEQSCRSHNVALARPDLNEPSALLHFLTLDHAGVPAPPGGVLGDGLEPARFRTIPDQAYARRLFRSIFHAQSGHPGTNDRLWAGVDGALIETVRGQGGLPYFIIGDSSTFLYVRSMAIGENWTAPLRLWSPGITAASLDIQRKGSTILEWARSAAGGKRRFDVPIFLKFGGKDAEYSWIWNRLRNGLYEPSIDRFAGWALSSVEQYGALLDAMTQFVDRRLLRVCSVSPSVLGDAIFPDSFLRLFGVHSPADKEHFGAELSRMDGIDFVSRSRLRALYDDMLRQVATGKRIPFIDNGSPLLDDRGVLDERYRRHDDDHHVDFAASAEVFGKILEAWLAPTEAEPSTAGDRRPATCRSSRRPSW